MVTKHAYAPPLIETVRRNIDTVAGALSECTGMSRTLLSRIATGDRAFLFRLSEDSISVRSYDTAMSRLSAVWPDFAAWPENVPRPAPGDVPADLLETAQARIAKARERLAEGKPVAATSAAHAGGDQAPAIN